MKQSKVILSVLTALSLITACQPFTQNAVVSVGNKSVKNINTRTTISGKVEFPGTNSPQPSLMFREEANTPPSGLKASSLLTPHSSLFTTQATQTDIASAATVSIIYPQDYSNTTLRNVTVASTVTKSDGTFTVKTDESFQPVTGDIFVLEAIKRIGGGGKNLMSIRTLIRWKGTVWESITLPNLFINTKTTAMVLMAEYKAVSSANIINKIENSVPIDVNTSITAVKVLEVANLIDYLLLNDKDPVAYLKYDVSANTYTVNNPVPVANPTPIPTPIPTPAPQTPGTIVAFAGWGWGQNGPATSIHTNYLEGVAVDSSGNVYVADTSNHLVWKVKTDGTAVIIAGTGSSGFSGDNGQARSAMLNNPSGILVDNSGNIYIADTYNDRIRKVNASGIISTFAGGSSYTSNLGDGGLATSAYLNDPKGMSFDSTGNLLIADYYNNRIRKVNTSTGIISTFAGTGTSSFGGDGGLATSAYLYRPSGVAVDSSGNIYIADTNNGRIRKVDASGIISTFAGGGSTFGDGGGAASAYLIPAGVAVDSSGNVYIADTNYHRIRKVNASTWIISTVAGTSSGFGGDGGSATSASLNSPSGVAIDNSGNIYIADRSNKRIRKVNSQNNISTIAGYGIGDGGPAVSVWMDTPDSVTLDNLGNVYFTETSNQIIKMVNTSNVISTFAGVYQSYSYTTDGSVVNKLYNPKKLRIYNGSIYLIENNYLRKIASNSVMSTLAGNGSSSFSGDAGTATSAGINPTGYAIDSSGNVYIADNANHRIRKVNTTGVISTIAGNGTAGYSGDGGPALLNKLNYPTDVEVDNLGNIYFSDQTNNRIRKIDSLGIITTVAGTVLGYSGDGFQATLAKLSAPKDIEFDNEGNLFFIDSGNNVIRKIDTNGFIYTVAGTGTVGYSGDGGSATSAMLNNPTGITIDPLGNIYIADTGNSKIRKVLK